MYQLLQVPHSGEQAGVPGDPPQQEGIPIVDLPLQRPEPRPLPVRHRRRGAPRLHGRRRPESRVRHPHGVQHLRAHEGLIVALEVQAGAGLAAVREEVRGVDEGIGLDDGAYDIHEGNHAQVRVLVLGVDGPDQGLVVQGGKDLLGAVEGGLRGQGGPVAAEGRVPVAGHGVRGVPGSVDQTMSYRHLPLALGPEPELPQQPLLRNLLVQPQVPPLVQQGNRAGGGGDLGEGGQIKDGV
mmetsp:Transcript_60535/g.162405  ORF Transcript_60535/g.162405 Transcript_60535/m.162405 type:complete len:239 (+) Transcript_60535:395-1111(+)